MRPLTPDDGFETLRELIQEEKREALDAFDADEFARGLRQAAATTVVPAPRGHRITARLAFAGLAATVLVVVTLGVWLRGRSAAQADPETIAAALGRCPFYSDAAGGAVIRPNWGEGVPSADGTLVWTLQSLIYRAQRACADCPAGDGVLTRAFIVGLGGGRPETRIATRTPVSSSDLSGRLAALARTDAVVRALGRKR